MSEYTPMQVHRHPIAYDCAFVADEQLADIIRK